MAPTGNASGELTSGPERNGLVRETVGFIRGQLAAWRDDPERAMEGSEERLNSQLCKFLDVRARHDFPMARFNHEEPQAGHRRVDLSVIPVSAIVVGTRLHTKYEPFLVIEGKRLPPPSADREKEYVTGFDRRSGGIQRFKLGLHGAGLDEAAMIGYVQAGESVEWLAKINDWISGLIGTSCCPGCHWIKSELVTGFTADTSTGVSSGESLHPRQHDSGVRAIRIHHLWVTMAGSR